MNSLWAALAEPALTDETDFEGFRCAARQLLAERVAPEDVQWRIDPEAAQLANAESDPPRSPRVRVPPAFMNLLHRVCLHSDPSRFDLMYRLLWRIARDPALAHDPLDADRVTAERMARAVSRDMHKTKAFVRFRPVTVADGTTRHVAWFEPLHHTIESVAPFFVRRFTTLHWAILTPRRSVQWQPPSVNHPQGCLHLGPGADRAAVPEPDAGEALWLTYYRHIFNPARLKLAMMAREMPRAYWANLPEAALITELAAQATERSGRMVEASAQGPRRRIAMRPRTASPGA